MRSDIPRPTFPLFFVEPHHSHSWEKSPPNQTLASLQETLLSAFEGSEETYGPRRLSQAVTDLGIKVGRFKALRLMQELAIKAKCPKAKVWRKQAVDFAENLANEQCAMMPSTLWAATSPTFPPMRAGCIWLS